jgi:hypothetical protein
MQKIVSMLAISLLISFKFVSTSAICEPYNYGQSVSCFQINLWHELNSLLNQSNVTSANYIYLFPAVTSSLILTSEIWNSFARHLYPNLTSLHFYRLEGISFSVHNAGKVDCSKYRLVFDQSVIKFFIGDKPPLSQFECNRDLIHRIKSNIFQRVCNVQFKSGVKFCSKPMCPFVFANTRLNKLAISNQIDTFLIKNLFRFQSINHKTSINSMIFFLEIRGYNIALDENLVNTLVFESVEEVKASGKISLIQLGLFKSFNNLSYVSLNLYNLMNFFHQVGIEWTHDLKANSVVYLDNFASDLWLDPKTYTYPDEDFCLFVDWPHNKFIMPLLSNLNF